MNWTVKGYFCINDTIFYSWVSKSIMIPCKKWHHLESLSFKEGYQLDSINILRLTDSLDRLIYRKYRKMRY